MKPYAPLACALALVALPGCDELFSTTVTFTDEAGAMEALGHKPLLVPGGAQNFKVTYPDDFALAEAVLRSRAL